MQRAITGFHQDEKDDWVAELSCGHSQHVRHRPPFQTRPWVLESLGRAERVGTMIDCPLCDRAELPEGLRLARTSPEWDERTLPAGLLRSHRVASNTWARITVREGRLRFTASTQPPLEVVLVGGSTQAVPPDIGHGLETLGPVRFSIEFFTIDERLRPRPKEDVGSEPVASRSPDEGGDPACWAALLCPECGAVLDGGPHKQHCSQSGDP
ncbi:MAG: DUF3565 domain-containing protein [Acidimicrobiales bacterium]